MTIEDRIESLKNTGMLDDMLLDRQIHKLKYQDYPNSEYLNEEAIWRRWLV